ncbi:MMPL family transporter [Actinokineospora cianjurensis]|uniref:RND superfamily putative drug exporter n=1 Tax=Actinokineospora cianjurensis TaxID=585224 RepID=A0A421AVW5_9PSEU|nr:MMPL family transporter [Actinokineospora cianjurensis]RLK53880.1 RND superfamily putative drug exporter [Actinokineospora cianjurensis]
MRRTQDHRPGVAERVTDWSIRHRGTAILGWLGLVALALVASVAIGGRDAANLPPGEGGAAQAALNEQGEHPRYHENVLVQALEPGGPDFLDDPRTVAAARDLVTRLREHPEAVSDVRSPLEAVPGYVSADRRSGLVSFTVNWPVERFEQHMATATGAVAAVAAGHPAVRVAQAGDRSLISAVDAAVKADLHRSHLLSLPFVLVILLVVFGSVVAAGVPVLLTGTAIAGAVGLVGVLGKVIPINSAASAMIVLVGVAVGVDYSLFALRRYREERRAGHDEVTALRTTARTSGHVVLVSGMTVVLCLGGLLFTGLGVFVGVTIGLALVVALAVLASVTVLPAVLAALGPRVDKWRVRRVNTVGESRFWTGIARGVVAKPLLWGGLGVLALLVLAVPALDMRLQDAASTNSLPQEVATVDSAIRMGEAFPGVPVPAQVVVWRPDGESADTSEVRAAIDRLHGRIAASGGLLAEPFTVDRVDNAVVIRVPLAGSSTDELSVRALELLRTKVIPETVGAVGGVEAAVTGRTATAADFVAEVRANTWLVFGYVLLVSLLLMLVVFRSLAIPVLSILLNLLSLGAAYGVVTWVFQEGNLHSLLGFTSYGAVMSWLPLFLFVVLFGLSTDYHLFILSRVRERWAAGATAREAVVGGIGHSAGVVSSAAVVMVVVFAVFITLTSIENKMLGVGLAVAVALDATVVRGVLLPAALAVLGERAWVPGRVRRRSGGR